MVYVYHMALLPSGPRPDPDIPYYYGINAQGVPVTLSYPTVTALSAASSHLDFESLGIRVVKVFHGQTQILDPKSVELALLMKL